MFASVKYLILITFLFYLLYRKYQSFVLYLLSEVKINYLTVYYLSLILLPITYGKLKIRIGAGWEPYIPFIWFVFFSMIAKRSLKIPFSISLFFVLSIVSLVVSDLFGLIFLSNVKIPEVVASQIKSPFFCLSVEAIRFLTCVVFFVVTYSLLTNLYILKKIFRYFLFGWLLESIYCVYEVILIKYLHLPLPFLNYTVSYALVNVRAYGTFFEPTQCGQFLLVGLLVYLLYFSLFRNYFSDFFIRRRKIIIPISILAFMLTLSRTAFLAIAIAIMVFSLFEVLRFKIKNTLKIFGLLITIVFIGKYLITILWGGEFLSLWISQLTNPDYPNSIPSRMESALQVLSQILNDILSYPFGIGTGLSIISYSHIPGYFQWIVEQGVLGIALIFWLILKMFNSLLKSYKLPGFDNLLLLFICVVLIFVNYFSYNHPWTWFVWTVIIRYPDVLRNKDL